MLMFNNVCSPPKYMHLSKGDTSNLPPHQTLPTYLPYFLPTYTIYLDLGHAGKCGMVGQPILQHVEGMNPTTIRRLRLRILIIPVQNSIYAIMTKFAQLTQINKKS